MTTDESPRQLDPQVKKLLERAAAAALPPLHTLSAPEARMLYQETRRRLEGESLAMRAVDNIAADTDAGKLPLRLYRPHAVQAAAAQSAAESEAQPCLVYFHGGGWTIGDLDSHDSVCRRLALYGRCVVIAADYRLSPEHKFPAAFDDAVAAVRWVARHSTRLGIDPRRIAIGGDSAGGNLAAAAAIALRGGDAAPCYQLLLYPATDMAFDTASHRRLAEGHFLTRLDLQWFRSNYLRSEADGADWRASPLRAPDLAGLPPGYLITAGFDPLLDEGRAYARRLADAGVDLSYECFDGMIHGFASMPGLLAAAGHALHRSGQMLQAAFGLAVMPGRAARPAR